MLPITYYFSWEALNPSARRCAMAEFAANGAKHIVLTDGLMAQLCGDGKFYRELQESLRSTGLDFVDGHAPFGLGNDLAMPVLEERPQMLERARMTLRLCRDFGVRSCCFHIGLPLIKGYSFDQYRDATRDSLEQLLPLAEKLGVIICIENIYYPLSSVHELLMYIREFPSPYLGICYDAGHAHIMEHGQGKERCPHVRWDGFGELIWEKDCLVELQPHIVMSHLHDNMAGADIHQLPGQGTIDWSRVVAGLKKCPRMISWQSEVGTLNSGLSIRELCLCFDRLIPQ